MPPARDGQIAAPAAEASVAGRPIELVFMLELISPTIRLRRSWLASCEEWGLGVHQDGAGLHPDDDVDTPAGFSSWVERLLQEADTSIPAREGRVHATYWWVAQGGTYLGAISLRHELNDFLLRAGGHIGYGIRPSARGRGVATWALRSARCPGHPHWAWRKYWLPAMTRTWPRPRSS